MCQNVKSWATFQNFRFKFRKLTTFKTFAWTNFRELTIFKIFARTKFRELGQNSRKSRKLILTKINPFKVAKYVNSNREFTSTVREKSILFSGKKFGGSLVRNYFSGKKLLLLPNTSTIFRKKLNQKDLYEKRIVKAIKADLQSRDII